MRDLARVRVCLNSSVFTRHVDAARRSFGAASAQIDRPPCGYCDGRGTTQLIGHVAAGPREQEHRAVVVGARSNCGGSWWRRGNDRAEHALVTDCSCNTNSLGKLLIQYRCRGLPLPRLRRGDALSPVQRPGQAAGDAARPGRRVGQRRCHALRRRGPAGAPGHGLARPRLDRGLDPGDERGWNRRSLGARRCLRGHL